MAISINTSMHVNAALPIDDRFVMTKTQMLSVNDAVMPDVYPCWCKDDGKMYLYNKSNTVDALLGKFREFVSGSAESGSTSSTGGGEKTVVTHSSTNGNITVDGDEIVVYDDSALKKLATHTNISVLNKFTESEDGVLLYNKKNIGLYFDTASVEKNTDVLRDTMIYDLTTMVKTNEVIVSSELLLSNLSSTANATVVVSDAGIEVMNLILAPSENQKYRLGSSRTLKVFVNGNIHTKLDITYYGKGN